MPRVVDHDERRERIAEAAWRVIEREGLEGANLRDIAREAGHTTGVLSHYFRGKRELMAFAFQLVVDRSTRRIARRSRDAGVIEALAELLPLDEERRREATVWLVLMAASLSDQYLAGELRQRYAEARKAMLPVFREALGEAAGEDPEDVGDELLAAVDGIIVDALTDPDRYPSERQLALLRRALARLGLPP
jgi:AcrR family transcriptional regulator